MLLTVVGQSASPASDNGFASLAIADPWIEQNIGDVHEEVHDENHHQDHQYQRLHNDDLTTQHRCDELAGQTPVGRNAAPEDFVTAVVFLSANGSGFVNGANIVVDGGWSIW